MNITYLGSGNAFAHHRFWGCILVNDTIMLDASPILLWSMKRLGVSPASIRHIFLSHFHGDHFFGLPFLFLEYHFVTNTSDPLVIIGPPGVEDKVTEVMTLAYPDVMRMGWPRPLMFIEADPSQPLTVEGLTFETVEMEHSIVTAYGYRLHLPDGILAYSGDTGMTEALYRLVEDAQVIILEADSQETSSVHLGRQALRTVLNNVPGNAVVFLTHLDAADAEPWTEFGVIVPDDLQRYTLTFVPDGMPEVSYA
jgi:ribonuclease BN (tRNA processing enzyme)